MNRVTVFGRDNVKVWRTARHETSDPPLPQKLSHHKVLTSRANDGALPGLDVSLSHPNLRILPLFTVIPMATHLKPRSHPSLACSSNPTILSTHSRCSGFISTDRKQVTVFPCISAFGPDSRHSPLVARHFSSQNLTGNSASAKCNPRRAAAAKIRRDFALISASDSPFGTNTKISSSGSNAASNCPPLSMAAKNRSAASLPFSSPRANSPSRSSGSSFCVAHSAAAAAPGREHSRLISPKCNSAELKYVYGESCLYNFPTPGSRKITQPHPYGCNPCLCGSITSESASPIRAKLFCVCSAKLEASTKYPPYAASTCTRNPYFSLSCKISGSGSTDPVAVVPSVATTVPTSPRAARAARKFISIRPRSSHSTFSNGNCSTPEILPWV